MRPSTHRPLRNLHTFCTLFPSTVSFPNFPNIWSPRISADRVRKWRAAAGEAFSYKSECLERRTAQQSTTTAGSTAVFWQACHRSHRQGPRAQNTPAEWVHKVSNYSVAISALKSTALWFPTPTPLSFSEDSALPAKNLTKGDTLSCQPISKHLSITIRHCAFFATYRELSPSHTPPPPPTLLEINSCKEDKMNDRWACVWAASSVQASKSGEWCSVCGKWRQHSH